MTSTGARCEDGVFLSESGSALLGMLQESAYARIQPLNVSLELTLNCNIRCLHCYNFDRDDPRARRAAACGQPAALDHHERQRPVLSAGEVIELVGQLREAGCLFLSLTGGEALTSPHLFRVLDRAREVAMAVQILSNGTLLAPGIAARLAGYRNLMGMSVSVYGATPQTHDGITQVAGSWRRTWDGMARLAALGIAIRVKLIVMRQNAHEVEAMRSLAEGRGLPYAVDVTITPRHDGSTSSLETRVTEEQLAALYAGPLRDLLRTGKQLPTEESFPCNCARANCAISAYGDVYPCISVPWKAGNVREQPFIDIWRTSPVFERIRALRMADYASCAPCPDKAFCSRSRGAAFNASGSYTGVDRFVCTTAAITRKVVEGRHAAPTTAPTGR